MTIHDLDTPTSVAASSENLSEERVEVLNSLFADATLSIEDIRSQFQTANTDIYMIETVTEAQAYAQYLKEKEVTVSSTTKDIDALLAEKARLNNRYGSKVVHIAPRVFFDYIKGSLNEVEVEDLTKRLYLLKQIFDVTAKSGQLRLNEDTAKYIVDYVKQNEAAACGYTTYITQETIQFFLKKVKLDRRTPSVAYFKPLREFPRLIPDAILTKLAEAQSKEIFEEFWILYLDYAVESAPTSTAQRVKEKDPILFGKVSKSSPNLFYIADWEDEYCDLTLQTFIKEVQAIDKAYTLPEVSLPTMKDLGTFFVEGERQKAVLANTKRSNFEELVQNEEQRLQQASQPTTGFSSWFQRLKASKKRK